MTGVELTVGDFTRAGLAPGSEGVLHPESVARVRAEFTHWLGVGPRGAIVFPFTSLPPVPAPLQHGRDGRGRLPPDVTPMGARHPVWWLDAHTKWRDGDEDELAYGVRLISECQDRGMWVAGEGPLDALDAVLGWRSEDHGARSRIAAYARGEWEPALARLEIGPRVAPAGRSSEVVTREDHKRFARALLAPRRVLLTAADERLRIERVERTTAERERLGLLERRLDARIQAVRHHLTRLTRATGSGDRGRLLACRRQVSETVGEVVDLLVEHDLTVRRSPDGGTGTGNGGRRAVMESELGPVMGTLYADPGGQAAGTALGDLLTGWRDRARGAGVAARDRDGPGSGEVRVAGASTEGGPGGWGALGDLSGVAAFPGWR